MTVFKIRKLRPRMTVFIYFVTIFHYYLETNSWLKTSLQVLTINSGTEVGVPKMVEK